MSRFRHLWLVAFCLAVAFLQGLIVLKVHTLGEWLLFFGIPGAIPFLLLNGVHGDFEGPSGFVGAVLYVLTNGAVYYGIVMLVVIWRRARRGKPGPID